MDFRVLDDLVRRLAEALPRGLEDTQRNVRELLESGLRNMKLVTRTEFDVQTRVLARARERIAALEQTVTDLEQALRSAPPAADSEPRT